MTGPRLPTVHPHRRRARHLLPLLVVTMLSQLACSDQPTEPAAPAMAVASVAANAPKVLILADIDGPLTATEALATSLSNAGYQVTVRPGPEYSWDGTDPAPGEFKAIVHLNGATYFQAFSDNAQTALTSFVQAGGGYVGGQLNGLEQASGMITGMSDLVLQGFGTTADAQDCFTCDVDYNAAADQVNHPVLDGLPSSFKVTADYHNAGPLLASEFSTVLMTVNSTAPAITVRDLGAGRVVNFSFAPNYMTPDDRTLFDPEVQRLYFNAVRWAGRAEPAAKSPATLTLADPTPTYDGTVKAALVSTEPAGLSGVALIYSQGGIAVAEPVNAGVYQVRATLNNPAYEAAEALGTLTIKQAIPTINWASPATITVGTPLGASQLNASATGVAGIALLGQFVYAPAAGRVLAVGAAQPLSVEFIPSDPNYARAISTVTITVEPAQGLHFTGFFAPVKNAPAINGVGAGATIALQFSLGGDFGLNVLQAVSTSSSGFACGMAAASRTGSADRREPSHGPGQNRQQNGQWVDDRNASLTDAGSGLSYSAARDRYTYLWSTSRSWSGTCRSIVLTLTDGSRHEAIFAFVQKEDQDQRGQHWQYKAQSLKAQASRRSKSSMEAK